MSRKYLIADETGNMDFRDHVAYQGPSRYFGVGTVLVEGDEAMDALQADMLQTHRNLIWNGVRHDSPFHASEDPPNVRSAVFDVLARHPFRVDVTFLEKAKAEPQTRLDEPTFYKYAWFYHLKYLASRVLDSGDEVMIIAASLGTKKRKRMFRQAVEDVVEQCCDSSVSRRVAFWPANSDPGLQVADYALWAVARYWERGDNQFRELIRSRIHSEFDLWSRGTTYYYGPKCVAPAS